MSSKRCSEAGCKKWEFQGGKCKAHYNGPPVSSAPDTKTRKQVHASTSPDDSTYASYKPPGMLSVAARKEMKEEAASVIPDTSRMYLELKKDDQPRECATRVIVVAGPPGSGKGTQCQLLAAARQYIHISTGDIFRDAVEKQTELGKEAEVYIKSGSFVPNALVQRLVFSRLQEPDAQRTGVVLDGYPRTPSQALALAAFVHVEHFCVIHVPDEICIKRVLQRLIDKESGAIYNEESKPPPAERKEFMMRRDYDEDGKIQDRLKGYKQVMGAIVPTFRRVLFGVNGVQAPEAVQADITRQLDKLPMPRLMFPFCVLCKYNAADCLLLPCGHQCYCEPCLAAVESKAAQEGKEVPDCTLCTDHTKFFARIPVIKNTMNEADRELKQELVSIGVAQPAAADDGWGEDAKEDTKTSDGVITMSCSACTTPKENEVIACVSIRARDATKRVPMELCCVVDISGSMGNAATYEDANGVMRCDGYSVLDIVKHGVLAIICSLTPQDRFALVVFDSRAETVFPLTVMNSKGRQDAAAAVRKLVDRGTTNIWAGLESGMDALRTADQGVDGARKSVLLLTDGVPSDVPQEGHVPRLRRYLESYPDFSFQLNTFGFGNNLDSQLLLDLAQTANGTYAFIPDVKIVGTCFVNAVANAGSTFVPNATLHLSLKNGATFDGPVRGSLNCADASWGKVIALGPLQLGQSRDVVVPLKLAPGSAPPYFEAHLVYPKDGGGEEKHSMEFTDLKVTPEALTALARAETVDVALQAQGNLDTDEGFKQLTGLASKIEEWTKESHDFPLLKALSADVSGRLCKAWSTNERRTRWGKHYVSALVRSHQLQLCTNFMDPGLQVYGGTLFKLLVELGGAIFLALPEPKKSRSGAIGNAYQVSSAPSYTPSAAAACAAPAMADYYAGSGGGCFAGDCRVLRLESVGVVSTQVRDVRAGDYVAVASGFARVVYAVQVQTEAPLVALAGGLKISPSHPIRMNGQWVRPKFLSPERLDNAEKFLFNFVLESSHVLLVNGVECITWGHGNLHPDVFHPFFGSAARVCDALELVPVAHGRAQVRKFLKDSSRTVGFL